MPGMLPKMVLIILFDQNSTKSQENPNVTVMAPLFAYLVSEPLGLTLGSQCALETVKMDLLFEELLFVQNS